MTSTKIGSVIGLIVAGVMAAEASAAAKVIRVPADAPTIQAAVNSASDGDVVRVAPGRWCGASIDREVALIATPGATIKGCAELTQFGGLRVGFLLVDARASGTRIHGFVFDGAGVSVTNLDPIGLAILGRDAHGVVVSNNWIEGTVQGITNSGGDGWLILGNVVHDLTIFGCLEGDTRCGGGVGIVIQQRDVNADRARDNVVLLNAVDGSLPDGLSLVGMSAVFVLGQDHPIVALDRVAIPQNPNAPATGIGIQVTDVCCGDPTGLLTTKHAIIVGNDGRGSQIAVEVDRDASGGTGNSEGAVIEHNLGVVIVDGVIKQAAVRTAGPATPRPFE